MAVQTQIQARRGTAATWTSTNPTLAAGETGYETDTGKFKIGNGSTAWASLAYATNGAAVSPLTTKGDLYTYSTADARLAVGNNGETLVADSSTSTGLRYTSGNPIPNPVLNSAMSVWQRGTSFAIPSGANTYTTDRWACFRGATGVTVSRQTVSDTTNLPFIQYVARVQRDSGNTSTVVPYLAQNFETVNAIPYAGKTVTLSFYGRRGANYSAANNYLTLQFLTGTGTDQSWLGYTGASFALNQNDIVLTTTIQRFSYTFTIGATATEFAPVFSYTPVGTAGANDWFEVTGVQLDVGSVALPFRTNGETIQGELAACRRYLPAFDGAASGGTLFNGYAYGTNTALYAIAFDVPARVAPTGVTISTNVDCYALNAGTSVAATFGSAGTTSAQILAGFTITAGQGSRLQLPSGTKMLFTGCEL